MIQALYLLHAMDARCLMIITQSLKMMNEQYCVESVYVYTLLTEDSSLSSHTVTNLLPPSSS